MKLVLTFVAFLYHGDGSVETQPQQSMDFTDKAVCEEMRATLLRRNWDNPLPIPPGIKPEDYMFSRYQVGACAEDKPKAAAPAAPATPETPKQ